MGTLTVITGPVAGPVTLTEAKAALRVDHSDDDARLTAMILAATAMLETYTGLHIMSQVVERSYDKWGSESIIDTDVWPLQSIDSVKYDDTASPSVETTLVSEVDYYADVTTIGGRVINTGYGWPSTQDSPNSIRIRMTAGYATAGDVPDIIKEAIFAYMVYMYDNVDGMKAVAEVMLWHSKRL
jgi:uncharacterized phiE125 gp8 family phage protein